MKIILTVSEVIEILLRHFPGQNLSATDIEIESPIFKTKPCETKVCEMAAWARARAFKNKNNIENWIPSIKQLRAEIPGLSLADAKTAIDLSYETVLSYFSNKGTLTGIFHTFRR